MFVKKFYASKMWFWQLLKTNDNIPLQPNTLVVDAEKFTSSSTGKNYFFLGAVWGFLMLYNSTGKPWRRVTNVRLQLHYRNFIIFLLHTGYKFNINIMVQTTCMVHSLCCFSQSHCIFLVLLFIPHMDLTIIFHSMFEDSIIYSQLKLEIALPL